VRSFLVRLLMLLSDSVCQSVQCGTTKDSTSEAEAQNNTVECTISGAVAILAARTWKFIRPPQGHSRQNRLLGAASVGFAGVLSPVGILDRQGYPEPFANRYP